MLAAIINALVPVKATVALFAQWYNKCTVRTYSCNIKENYIILYIK